MDGPGFPPCRTRPFTRSSRVLLGTFHFLAEKNPDPNGRYLFFPGLIRIDIPERVWEKDSSICYHFGWILQTSQDTEFFDPRCFQVNQFFPGFPVLMEIMIQKFGVRGKPWLAAYTR